jgi:hypothetical protein
MSSTESLLSVGKPASSQRSKPPRRMVTSSNPRSSSLCAARALEFSLGQVQYVTMGRPRGSACTLPST